MHLFEARAKFRMTQWDIRRVTSIHQSKISLIEHGHVVPSDEEKSAIAGALGIAVNEIEWPEEALHQCQEVSCP